jgi:hypothetical protein
VLVLCCYSAPGKLNRQIPVALNTAIPAASRRSAKLQPRASRVLVHENAVRTADDTQASASTAAITYCK